MEAHKDVYYRLKNSSSICWRSILWLFSLKAIKQGQEKGTTENNAVKCLVFDDSVLPKTGRYIE
jgi:hypothetical protein